MYQPVQPHAFPLLTYEAYLRAQLEHAMRMANANANPNSTFSPPADAHVALYHLGCMPPVKVHVEYTLPPGQHALQLPFGLEEPFAPINTTFPFVPAVTQAGSVSNAASAVAPPPMPTVDTGSGSGTGNETSVASSIQPAGQQSTARPDNSPLVLPRPAALRDAVEKRRQAAQASQVAHDRPHDAADSISMRVDGHPRPGTTSPLSSNTSPKTAQTAAEPIVKTEQQGTGKKALHPERHRYKIRGTKRYARWYATKSALPIPAPPEWLRPTHGFLYVHQHKRGAQVWMYYAPDRVRRGEGPSSDAVTGTGTRAPLRLLSLVSMGTTVEDGRWVKAEEGLEHPGMEGYVLLMTEDDEPRWVKRASARNNRRARARE
ncbi:hypothetical protein OH76DRAFT_926096 [Lentinus brumalis]|uniref:Uncharacterized protein n=1 Tax=Lentinus brumalis TaxID=2498619 RepID=A0A371CZY6_9APHY|nr:hypothetical protein OH76DRAFT_926096 [Polyporus brumalis]